MSRERELLESCLDEMQYHSLVCPELVFEIQELIAQPEQKPVAWQFRTFHGEYTVCPGWDVWENCTESKFNNVSEYVTKGFYQVRKLYTAPPKREPIDTRRITLKMFSEGVDMQYKNGYVDGIRFAEKMHGITGGGE